MNNNGLVAEQRTDKNGVTRRMWVKPQQNAASSKVPMPKLVLETSRQENIKIITRALDDFGMMISPAKEMLGRAVDEEIQAIVSAINDHGEPYVESLVHSAYMGRGASTIADLALVYDPECHTDVTGKVRDDMILNSVAQACVIAGCGERTKSLVNKSPEIIQRTRNFVRLYDAAKKAGTKEFTKDFLSLGLGDTGRNAEDVLNAIRNHRVNEPSQIEFILDGGTPAIADGAL